MRKDHLLIWDDFVPIDEAVYETSSVFDDKLGRFDQLALFAVLTRITPKSGESGGTFQAWIVHSGDGETFVQKNGSAPEDGELQAQWNADPLPEPHVAWGSDPNTNVNPPTPFLRYVRLRLQVIGAIKPVHLRIYATLRDQGG